MFSSLRSVLAVTLIAGTTLVAGCDRDDSSVILSDAAAQLSNVGPSGQAPASGTAKQDTLRKVLQNLQPLASSNVPAVKAAASVLMSQAHAGLAENPSQLASDLERQSLQQLTRLRAGLDRYLSAQGQATAAAFDPAKAIAEIDGQEQKRQADLAKAEADRNTFANQIADLRAKSQAASTSAKERQNQAGLLRQQATGAGGVQGEALLRQARDVSRDADRLEAEAAELEAKASSIDAETPIRNLAVARLQRQGELIAQARAEVQARAATAKTEVARSTAEAEQAAKDLSAVAAELDTLRSGDLAKAYEESLAGYTKAVSTARAGMADSRAAAQLAAATASQSLGDIHWTRTHGLLTYAEVMGAIASAKPAPKDAAAFADRASAARAQIDEAKKAATEAYQAAKAAYEGAGGGPDSKKAIERLNERLTSNILATSNGEIDLRPKPETPAEQPAEAPAAQPAAAAPATMDLSTTKGFAAALIDAGKRKDVAAVFDLYHVTDPADEPMLASMRAMGASGLALDTALMEKFGKDLAEISGQRGGGALNANKLATLTPEQLQFTESGDRATVKVPGDPLAIDLIKINNQWKVDFSATMQTAFKASGTPPEQARMAMGMMGSMGPTMDALAAEVKAGKFKTPEEFIQAFQRKIMESMGGGRAPGKGK